LKKNGIPGIEGVDTRAITKRIRVHGALKACLSTEEISDEEALQRAQNSKGIIGQDFVKKVTCKESFTWDPTGEESRSFSVQGTDLKTNEPNFSETHRLVAFDYGAKKKRFTKTFEGTVLKLLSFPQMRRQMKRNLTNPMPFSCPMVPGTLRPWIMLTKPSDCLSTITLFLGSALDIKF
jgi:carbamoyl-phosphate synthase small subunit